MATAKDNRSVYKIEFHGVERTFLMSEEDAEKYKGAVKINPKADKAKALEAANKAATPATK